jgi:hypothetical protein
LIEPIQKQIKTRGLITFLSPSSLSSVSKKKRRFVLAIMPPRPSSLSTRPRCLLRSPQISHRFSTRSNLRSADHGDHYDPPSGWLFGVKPGQKYEKEGWENLWYYGFIGSLVAAGVAYVFKPDTSYVNFQSKQMDWKLKFMG